MIHCSDVYQERFSGHQSCKDWWLCEVLFNFLKCLQASLSQMNETPFFIDLEKGWHLLERFEINLRMYASRPCNPLSSLRKGIALALLNVAFGKWSYKNAGLIGFRV